MFKLVRACQVLNVDMNWYLQNFIKRGKISPSEYEEQIWQTDLNDRFGDYFNTTLFVCFFYYYKQNYWLIYSLYIKQG